MQDASAIAELGLLPEASGNIGAGSASGIYNEHEFVATWLAEATGSLGSS